MQQYSQPTCRNVKNESLSMPPYAPLNIIYNRLVKRLVPNSGPNRAIDNPKEVRNSFTASDTGWIAFGTLLVTCIIGTLLMYIYHRHVIVRTQNAVLRTADQMARTLPTGTHNVGPQVDGDRMAELRRRMRAFVPAEDALRHLRTDSASRRASMAPYIDAETSTFEEDDSSYRQEAWVHHEAPPYNNNDWFFFSSGTASSDPWDFNHKKQHLDKASTHNWWHTPELKLAAVHDSGHECFFRALDTADSALTSSSDAMLSGARNRLARHLETDSDLIENKEEGEKEHFYSSWLRPDPASFGSVNIRTGNADSALAYIGCVAASSVGGSAMQKVPMEVPLDQSKLSWMPSSPSDTVSG
ncbi:MAG: hypothetical protein Q9157_006842 [Trypethelium eluteriae]